MDTKFDKNFFIDRYLRKKMTMQDISRECGRSVAWVHNKIHEFQIDVRGRGAVAQDLTGNRFGKIIVEGMVKSNCLTYANCLCDCGNHFLAKPSHLRAGGYTSCGCTRGKKKSSNVSWKGRGKISGFMWSGIIRTYKKSKKVKEFKITLDYVWDLFVAQNGKCALTGVDIDFADTNEGHKLGETTASLDRIDSSKGYVKGNVQWVHKTVNKLKGDLKEDLFKKLCRLVCEHEDIDNTKRA